jgi:hypothetical protein
MKARASNYPGGVVVAFGGLEFVKDEWRIVPVANEAEAKRHPYLEVLEEPKPAPKAAAAPKAAPKKTTTRRRTRRKTTPKASK